MRPLLILLLALVCSAALPAGARAQDAAELTVRVNRLENQMRQLSGQIEQLQFENRRLGEQLRKFQEDMEFRLGQGGAGPGGAGQRPSAPAAGPGAPPRALGGGSETPVQGGGGPVDLNAAGRPVPQGALAPGQRPETGAAPTTAAPRSTYDAALVALNARDYEQAEMGFRQFLQANPRGRLAASATYNLGESYFRRNRHRDAAEQYLKVTTEFGDASVAPDAMLKLGMSLAAIGAREQACATYARLAVRYPQAPAAVKTGVEREQRRSRCGG